MNPEKDISGYLVNNPELTEDGQNTYCHFRLAIKQENYKEIEYWIITTWGNQAKNCYKFLQKGSYITIPAKEAEIHNKLRLKNGTERFYAEIIAKRVVFVSNLKKQTEVNG